MPVRFILGRAGTGKTRHCLDALLAELRKPDESRRLILLVPEQASFQMERALVMGAPTRGYWRAEVLSFSRLAHRVFEESGFEPGELRPAARLMALRHLATAGGEAWRAFGGAVHTAGFFVQLDHLIEELMRENVSPADLAAAAERLTDASSQRRTTAVAQIYRAYLDWLGPDRIDPLQRLAAVRQRLASASWLGDSFIWVDGFAGFTGQELETLVTIARLARQVEITLLLDPASLSVKNLTHAPDVLSLFHRTETTYQRLVRELTDAAVELRKPVELAPPPPRFAQAGRLARLEAELARPIGVDCSRSWGGAGAAGRPGAGQQVRLFECQTHREEVAAAAHFIRRQVLQSNGELRFRDFAVIARDLEAFAPMIAEVFASYELPYFLDRRRPLHAHALTRFVHALLETVAADFATVPAVRLIRSGLLPLSRGEAEKLENAVVAKEVRGFDTWRLKRWDFERDIALTERRLHIADSIAPLVELAGGDLNATGARWSCAVYQTLGQLQVSERISAWIAQAKHSGDWELAETHRLAWGALCDVLEDLHDVLADELLDAGQVSALIGATLGQETIGLAPPTLDQVLVSSIERSRHPEIKYAWLLGFNEGVFPQPPAGDVVLSTADRQMLTAGGLAELRSRRDEVFAERLLAYIALTRPSRGLTVSYAVVGDNGEPRFPSPFVRDVVNALPGLRVEKVPWDQPPTCLEEFAAGYLGTRGETSDLPGSGVRFTKLHEALRKSAAGGSRLAWLLRGLAYTNRPAALPGYALPAAGEPDVAWDGSPTELNVYLQCPFKHFALHALQLDPWRGPSPISLELGRDAHQILAKVTERAIAAKRPASTLSDDRWLEFLHEAICESENTRPDDGAKRRPSVSFFTTALHSFLKEVVLAHAERWRRGSFEPLACERRFGAGMQQDALEGLELVAADGQKIRMHGFIDRVDRCEHDGHAYLLIYDYKPTARSLNHSYLLGYDLQLFVYALAVGQPAENGGFAEVGGVLVAPLFPDADVFERKYAEGACDAEMRMYLYRPRGLFDQKLALLLDKGLADRASPVACMRLKKKGGFDSRSDAKPVEELRARLELARRTVLQAGREIARGCIDISPLVERRTLACQTCEFKPLCRFEPKFNQPRAAEIWLPTLSQPANSERFE